MAEAGPKLLRGLLEVFVLESLEQSPKHGYALLREMAEAFGAEPNRNRLYPLLGRMVRDGLIRESGDDLTNGTRTLYELTDAGAEALESYRRIPSPFRRALERIWSVPATGAPRSPAAAAAAPAAAAPTPAPHQPALPGAPDAGVGPLLPPRAARIPVAHATAPAAATAARADVAPYPCPDARMALEKDPATGALAMRLTGCPMGSYSYCPECPVFKSVEGLRRLVFSF